jgi:hypothetical protein
MVSQKSGKIIWVCVLDFSNALESVKKIFR